MAKKSRSLLSILSLVLIVLLVLVAAVVGAVLHQLTPVSASEAELVRFVIPKGQALSVIGNRLAEEGLIRHPLAFRFAVLKDGLASKIQSGSFEVSPSMNTGEIARSFTQGSDDTWITIPEGWRVEEIAAYLANQELESFDEQEFLSLAQDEEGILFPETYLVPREFTAAQIYELLTDTFATTITELEPEIQASGRDIDEILIMASIVEREARGYEQMRQVAGVLWNRYDIDMALQADATLQYIEGYDAQAQGWWEPPSVATKQSSSPYNTYGQPGLPPRPIANPGADAIKATAVSADHDYLFYIHDTSGTIHYGTTLDEHNRNVQRYLR